MVILYWSHCLVNLDPCCTGVIVPPTWTHAIYLSHSMSKTWTHVIHESLSLQHGPMLYWIHCLSNLDPCYTWVGLSKTWRNAVLELLSFQSLDTCYTWVTVSPNPGHIVTYCTWVIVSTTWTHAVLKSVSSTWTHTKLESLSLRSGHMLCLNQSLQPGPILNLSHCPSNLHPCCTWVIVPPTWTHTVLESLFLIQSMSMYDHVNSKTLLIMNNLFKMRDISNIW